MIGIKGMIWFQTTEEGKKMARWLRVKLEIGEGHCEKKVRRWQTFCESGEEHSVSLVCTQFSLYNVNEELEARFGEGSYHAKCVGGKSIKFVQSIGSRRKGIICV